ncbi:MAG: hypothetical protein Q7U08_02800, partial [Flavobacteriaceae bacterium]|nr:hypothetical protein [Flavobacteriaceae bacterium]
EKMTFGLNLSNFQTVFEPSFDLKPTFNTNYSITYFNMLKDLKLEVNSGVLYGKSDNIDNQTVFNNIITQKANQLSNSYTAFSTTIIKNFTKFPFKVSLVPEMLNNQSYFI